MSKKKFTNQQIIEAIKAKFGSVEDFAALLGTTDKAVYARISNQSRQFLKLLRDKEVKINDNHTTLTTSGNQSPNVQGENSIIINQGNEDLEAYKIAFNSIKKELEEMRESVRKKEAEINVLKIEIEKLRGNKNK